MPHITEGKHAFALFCLLVLSIVFYGFSSFVFLLLALVIRLVGECLVAPLAVFRR